MVKYSGTAYSHLHPHLIYCYISSTYYNAQHIHETQLQETLCDHTPKPGLCEDPLGFRQYDPSREDVIRSCEAVPKGPRLNARQPFMCMPPSTAEGTHNSPACRSREDRSESLPCFHTLTSSPTPTGQLMLPPPINQMNTS